MLKILELFLPRWNPYQTQRDNYVKTPWFLQQPLDFTKAALVNSKIFLRNKPCLRLNPASYPTYLITPLKLLCCFLLVGTALCLIACILSDKGIIPCLVIFENQKLSMTKIDFSALILKAAAFTLFKTIFTLLDGLQGCDS